MRVLIACEFSGIVRDAFRARGHDAWSCDLEGVEPQGEWPNYHLYGDARWFLDGTACYAPWDLLIAHPPCTYLSSSGLHRTVRKLRPLAWTEDAVQFVYDLVAAPIQKICIENPKGYLSRALRKPDQTIQPYDFGHDASKQTDLWLKNLPLLRKTNRIEPRWVGHAPRWGNQTDSGQNRLPPSADRAAKRSITYPGIAAAMAEQWGGVMEQQAA